MKLLQESISFYLFPQTTFTSSFTILCQTSLYLSIDMCIYVTDIDLTTNSLLDQILMCSDDQVILGCPQWALVKVNTT